MALEKEMRTYEQSLPALLKRSGEYVLIHDDEVAGVYGTYEDALRAGYEKFALKPFLVKNIQAVDQVQVFTRDILPCPT